MRRIGGRLRTPVSGSEGANLEIPLFPSLHSDGEVWHLDVGSSHPGAGVGPKGWAVRPLKRHASWVQNVVRQFGLYPQWAQETCEELPLVREDWGGRTSGVRVVPPGAKSPVAMSGRDKR